MLEKTVPSEPNSYYFSSNDEGVPRGPCSGAQLKLLAKQGILKPEDSIWKSGSNQRYLASSVKGLFESQEETDPIIVARVVETTPPVLQPSQPHSSEPKPIYVEVAPSSINEASSTTTPSEPLEDPMREISDRFSRFLWLMFYWLMALSIIAVVLYIATHDGPAWPLIGGVFYFAWMLFFAYWINLVWWRAFAPRRSTDVLYLRSFQNDQVSWPIRVAIQDALGEQVRLSGIRDPRRRIMTWGDGLSPWLRAMRYCTPKFMDLEAEDDWKTRLWNSLQVGKMAIVDLSEVTPFVLDEVKLVTQAIGVERTVFLGISPNQNEAQIRELIRGQIGDQASARATLIFWPSDLTGDAKNNGLRGFKTLIRDLYTNAVELPAIVKCPPPQNFFVPQSKRQTVPMSRSMIKWMIGFQLVLVGFQIIMTIGSRALTDDEGARLTIVSIGSLPFAIVNTFFFFYNFVVYIRDVGILRRRIKAAVVMGLMLVAMWPLFSQFIFGEASADSRATISAAESDADLELLRREQATIQN